MRTSPRVLIRPTDENHSVTSLELFFDLVFVFAITQVTALMADDLGWRGAVRGLVVLALLWWAWCSYAWLGNQARADEGVIRVAVLLAMVNMFAVALCIPQAWTDDTGGLSAPLILAVCLSLVRLGHLGVYAVAAGEDRALRRQLARTAVPVTLAAALLLTGAALGGAAQTALWLAALVVDYAGIYLAGTDWRLPAPAHFAERHGLILIIALGESLIALGLGVADNPITWAFLAAAALGLTVSVLLWWSYFDVVSPVGEHALRSATGEARVRLGRDGYTYLHFPMVAGIVYLAVGLKKVAAYVADTGAHDLSDPLPHAALWSMYGGVAVCLLAHLAFLLRNADSTKVPRAVTAGVLLLIPALAGDLPALVALALLTAVLAALIAFEVVRYADARRAARAAHHSAT